MLYKNNKTIKIVIISLLVFIIWFGLALFRTLEKNPEWFTTKEEKSESLIERENINTTEKKEFSYALAWSKFGENWVLSNIDGYAEIVLDKNFIDVTDFGNTGYAVVKDIYGNKTLIDRAGNSRLYDNCFVCDKIITDDFKANMIVASIIAKENEKEITKNGIIDATLNWSKAPSEENEYLKEFTKGIDGGVFTNELGDKLYFYTLDRIVENVDEFLFYDAQTAMFRKGTTIYLIDKSGEHERVDFENVSKVGEWADETIFCEFTDGRKQLVDINGKCRVDLTSLNVINSPRMIGGHAGIVMETESGIKCAVIDENGKFLYEFMNGKDCSTLTEDYFRLTYFDESKGKDIIEVINENGEVIFEVESSITNFNNGYAIKDGNSYVRTDGTELQLYRNIEK